MATCILGVLLSFMACKKDRTTVFVNQTAGGGGGGSTSKFASMSAFYRTLKPAELSFSVNVASGGSIRGKRGMKFKFAPNAFMDNMGNPVTGDVRIRLTEVSNYAEMLGTGARTEAVNGILGSAAMFNITATKNGQPVVLSIPMQASIPVNENASLSNIELFSGNITSQKDSSIRWTPLDSGFRYNADSLSNVYDSLKKEYERKRIVTFDLYTFGWCNLDAYYNSSSGFPIKATFEGITNILNAECYMKLNQDDLKGLYRLTYDTVSDEFNSTNYNLPPGWNIHLILLVKDNNKKVYIEDRIISNGSSTQHFSNLKEISDADLETFFKGL
jgi:hypothetical protein